LSHCFVLLTSLIVEDIWLSQATSLSR
jgi:hypothetical protein